MRPNLLRCSGILALLLGCASTSSLSAQYALDPRAHPEGIDCFYSCLRQLDENERRWCLSLCDGVEVTATLEPCASGAPALCRGYPIRDSALPDAELSRLAAEAEAASASSGEDDYDDDDDSVAGEILGQLFVGLIEAAICGGDCDDDDDDAPRAHPDERRRKVRKDSQTRPAPRVRRAPAPSSDRRGRPGK